MTKRSRRLGHDQCRLTDFKPLILRWWERRETGSLGLSPVTCVISCSAQSRGNDQRPTGCITPMIESESKTYQVGTFRRLRHPRPRSVWSLQDCPEPMDPALWTAASAAHVPFFHDPVANAISHPIESWFDTSFRRHPSAEVCYATCLKVDNQSRSCLSIHPSFNHGVDYRRNWGLVWFGLVGGRVLQETLEE